MKINITKPITFGSINRLRQLHGIDLLKVLEPDGLTFFNDPEKTVRFISFFTDASYEDLMENPDFTMPAMEEISKEILLKLADFFPKVQGETLRHALLTNSASMETLQRFIKTIDQLTAVMAEAENEAELNDALEMLTNIADTYSNAPESSASTPTQEPPKN